MKTILIVGVETVVGANLAASWAGQSRVIGLSAGPNVSLPGCERALLEGGSADAILKCLQQTRASRAIFCGTAARSTWESGGKTFENSDVEKWAAAADQQGLHFTMISSDAVFTGPWLFHEEASTAHCPSREAVEIRETESRVLKVCEKSLIIRSNVFGWSPSGAKGWLESLLSGLEDNSVVELDPISHATPILASDLADCLEPALEDELTGIFHVAGAERVSPYEFARQLAMTFELAAPVSRTLRELAGRPTGFGRGETSLQTRKFRSKYDCSMPLLSDGLSRLIEQDRSGYRDALCGRSVRSGKAA